MRSVAVGLDRQPPLSPQEVHREAGDANVDLGFGQVVAATEPKEGALELGTGRSVWMSPRSRPRNSASRIARRTVVAEALRVMSAIVRAGAVTGMRLRTVAALLGSEER
jgi:hypothetical protein